MDQNTEIPKRRTIYYCIRKVSNKSANRLGNSVYPTEIYNHWLYILKLCRYTKTNTRFRIANGIRYLYLTPTWRLRWSDIFITMV